MNESPPQTTWLDRLITQLSRPPDGDSPFSDDVVATVAEAVLGLLGRREVLAHPTAALQLVDAVLTLASALRRHELAAGANTMAGGSGGVASANAVLEQLQAALAAPPASPAPGSELDCMVQRMGFRPADLQQVQQELALRTALAMQPVLGGKYGRGARLLRSTAPDPALTQVQQHQQQQQQPFALDAADTLLGLAVSLPMQHYSSSSSSSSPSDEYPVGSISSSGSDSSLHKVVAAGLLPLMRALPLGCQQLGQRGWESYFLLEPQALQQCLAEILQARTTAPPGAGHLPQLIAKQPHWAAAATAIATQHALHLLARHTLHAWLAESGSMAAWELLVELLGRAAAATATDSAAGGDRDGQQAEQEGGAGQASKAGIEGTPAAKAAHQWQQPWGQELPLALRLLHPAGPARSLAQLQHCAAPSAQGMAQAASLIEQAAPIALPSSDAAGHKEPAGGCDNHGASSMARAQQMWAALLDHPHWLLFALQRLPLQQAFAAAAGQAGEDGQSSWQLGDDGSHQGAGRGAVAAVQACAVYASWVMWPHHAQRRRLLQQALGRRKEGQPGSEKGSIVDLHAVLPWMRALQAWREHWDAVLTQG